MLFYEISYFLLSYIFDPFFGHVSVLFNGFRDYSILWLTRKPHRNQLHGSPCWFFCSSQTSLLSGHWMYQPPSTLNSLLLAILTLGISHSNTPSLSRPHPSPTRLISLGRAFLKPTMMLVFLLDIFIAVYTYLSRHLTKLH